MKYCPSCGGQVNENENVCPNCGANLGGEATATQAVAPVVQTNATGAKPRVDRGNIVTCIILSLVTCGIYGIIWFINMVNDVNTVCQDDKSNQSGVTVFLLTLVTCGIYGMYWFFTAGKRMNAAGTKYGLEISDNSIMYLVLMLFGLGIVNYCLLQSDLNKFAE